jgi:hypothetical protein
MNKKNFIDWVPIIVEHRPYDTESNCQPVGGCHECEECFLNGNLYEYPIISERPPRRVCEQCLEKDKQNGIYDAIMDIWDNYEEHEGIGHKLTIEEFLNRHNV